MFETRCVRFMRPGVVFYSFCEIFDSRYDVFDLCEVFVYTRYDVFDSLCEVYGAMYCF